MIEAAAWYKLSWASIERPTEYEFFVFTRAAHRFIP